MSAALKVTPDVRRLWEHYALAKMQAEDSLLLRDGTAAAQRFYDFLEAFAPQALGSNVVPFSLRRRALGPS